MKQTLAPKWLSLKQLDSTLFYIPLVSPWPKALFEMDASGP